MLHASAVLSREPPNANCVTAALARAVRVGVALTTADMAYHVVRSTPPASLLIAQITRKARRRLRRSKTLNHTHNAKRVS